jgi:DNA-binding CsgD family transcriptional regulator
MAKRKGKKHSETRHDDSPSAAWTMIADRFSWTGREAQIAQLLCDDHLEKQIARSLKISENTLHTHIRHIYAKMNVHNRAGFSKMIFKLLHDMPQRRDGPPHN